MDKATELERLHYRSVPFSQFQAVDVTFGNADQDFVIEHQLRVDDAESVNYEVLRADRGCAIYHDQGSTRRAWGRGYIILRSTVANAKVRLRLSVEG